MTPEIPSFNHTNILVIGDVMLDRYWYGNAHRISPEAPIPVVHVTESQDRPGGAGNVALNLSALGCQVTLLGIIGDDEAGDILEKQLQSAHIHCQLHRLHDFQTITKLRVLGQHQQLLRLDFEKTLDVLKAEDLISDLKRLLRDKKIDVLVLSDYAKGTLYHSAEFILAAKEANIPVLVDPKNVDFTLYQGATVITPNQKEFEAVVGRSADEADMITRGYGLLQQYNMQALLITRSEHGMLLLRENFPPLHLPTRAREVYDVTGAGDTVLAVLAASVAAGESLDKAAFLANTAAGLAVEKLGAVTISAAELHQALQPDTQHLQAEILAEFDLIQALHAARAAGEKIVMTNGCFDILHAGHVQYLTEAKTLGQRLVVAVNDDDSVRRLKGSSRPIVPLPERMAMLAGLRAVDWVVSFSEDTPARLIEQLQPDILVKGEDYRIDQIAGADHVLSSGGKVQLLSFKPGCSTSNLIKKICKTE
jgi:D-beta-D-heptose 7-phosphate kinase/D-beta-D-heptose 1-phosphate adenosyltransferase